MIENGNKTNSEHLEKMEDSDIDFSDIPELGDEFFRNATLRHYIKRDPSPEKDERPSE